ASFWAKHASARVCCPRSGKRKPARQEEAPNREDDASMASRVNRAIELLAEDQAIYYVGQHTGHDLSFARGRVDAATWADYINIGMEHGAFDMPAPAQATCRVFS